MRKTLWKHSSSRHYAIGLLLMIAALALLLPAKAVGQVVVDSKIDKADIFVGEQVKLTTTVAAGAGQKVHFPDYDEGEQLTPGVEVVEAGQIDTALINEGKRMKLSRTYTITSFDSALYNLPAMEVEVDGNPYKSHSKIGLKVGNVPVDLQHPDNFAPPFTTVESPYSWTWLLFSLSLTLWGLVALFVYAAVKLSDRRPMTKRVVIQPDVPPFKKASREIEKFKNMGVGATVSYEENKGYFVKLTDIVRRYLYDRFKFNALEKTTSEICEGIKTLVAPDDLRKLRDLFETADFVKFAKADSTPFERERLLNAASELLSNTRDESMEHPVPTIKIIELSSARQRYIRIAIAVMGAASTVLIAGMTIFTLLKLYDTYL